MSQTLPARVQDAREQLLKGRQAIQQAHAAGAGSLEVAAALAGLVDRMVAALAEAALSDLSAAAVPATGVALVALGGYGRRDPAPFSDVDLLLLYEPASHRLADQLCARLVQDYWDAGLALGWSAHTVGECVACARTDLSVHTALLEARHVYGDRRLGEELRQEIARLTRGTRCNEFIEAALAERAAERAKYGMTSHLLEPDLKKSQGGLRELHLLRWIAHAHYGFADLDRLETAGALTPEDAAAVKATYSFLLRIRHDLHFHARRAQDILTLDEQVRLASALGFQDCPGMRAVELFMRQYYRHCDQLTETVEQFAGRCRTRSSWRRLYDSLTAKAMGPGYHLAGGRICLTPTGPGADFGDLEQVVDLFACMNQHGAVLDPDVRQRLRAALPTWPGQDTAAAGRRFLALLGRPGHLGRVLQEMHALGVLEQLIPEFAHARGLIQFNQYHKYTVDEHTLLCVENAERLLGNPGPYGEVYREIHHKEILHLALLLHDLGKGFERDHSELGREIAQRAAAQLRLTPHLSEVLVFLVHRHLVMAHLAFRRDTSDGRLLACFARKVGTPEVLKMLFLLTAVDIMSVGPDVWTSWKAEVLQDLYARTLDLLGGKAAVPHAEEKAAALWDQVAHALAGTVPEVWLRTHLAAWRQDYFLTTPRAQIVEQLRILHSLPPGEVVTTSTYEPSTGITVYTVHTFDNIIPGLFSKVTGVLAAKGLQILTAQITTHRDGTVVDRFEVFDPHHNGAPPVERQAEVGALIREVVLGRRAVEALFTRRYRVGPTAKPLPATHQEPTKVEVDNDTSERCTIIEVFAQDHQGLLYVIARTLFELGLSVLTAKITTCLDQILDVFYVNDTAQQKITDPGQVDQIRQAILNAIAAIEGVPGDSGAG